MKSLFSAAMTLFLVAAISLLSPPVRGEEANVTPSAERIADLIKRLDDDEFVVREKATQELSELGEAAKPHLQTAIQSKSPEVSSRAAVILERIAARSRELMQEARLAALERELVSFLQDKEAPVGLPGWEVFKTAVGDSPASRKHFAELLRQYGGWLIEFDEQKTGRGKLLEQQLTERQHAIEAGEETSPAELNQQIGLFCLAYEMLRARPDPKTPASLQGMLAEVLLNDLSSLEQVSEPATKLFLCWYRKIEDDDINVTFAEALEGISWGRKSQTLVEQVLKEIVEDRKLAVQRRCQALVTRGNLQQKAAASRIWLESLLRDETAVGTFAFEDKNKSTCETQLRDVALLLLVEYFGPPNAKKYKEFRFAFAQSGSSREDFYEPAAFGFQKPEDRTAALAKWKDQPPAAAKPTGKKKGKK